MNDYCVNKVLFMKTKKLVVFGAWVKYFINLFLGSSKYLSKEADRIDFEVVLRDTREYGMYIMAYIIHVLYRNCINDNTPGCRKPYGIDKERVQVPSTWEP